MDVVACRVDIRYADWKLGYAQGYLERICENDGVAALYLNSWCGGKHSIPNSRHQDGRAIDASFLYRTGDWAVLKDYQRVAEKLKASLPKGFDVVAKKGHLHIEWDPKGEVVGEA